MSEHIGKFQELGFAVESNRGTAEVPGQLQAIQKIEANFYKNVEKVEDESTRATIADNQKLKKVTESVEGDVSMNLHSEAIGYLLYNVFGTLATTQKTFSPTEGSDIDLGVYDHALSVSENIKRKTLSVFYGEGDVEDGTVPGVVVNTLTISGSADELIKCNFSLLGRSEEDSSNTFTYSGVNDHDFIGRDVTIAQASTIGEVDYDTALDVKEFDIELDTGAEADYTMNGNYGPTDFYQGKLAISGSFVINYTNNTFKDLYNGDTPFAMKLRIQNPKNIQTVEGDAPDANPTIEILLPEVYIENWERSSDRDGVITQEITFKASYNDAESTIGSANVTNLKSTY